MRSHYPYVIVSASFLCHNYTCVALILYLHERRTSGVFHHEHMPVGDITYPLIVLNYLIHHLRRYQLNYLCIWMCSVISLYQVCTELDNRLHLFCGLHAFCKRHDTVVTCELYYIIYKMLSVRITVYT